MCEPLQATRKGRGLQETRGEEECGEVEAKGVWLVVMAVCAGLAEGM